jgi:hypothetical protein
MQVVPSWFKEKETYTMLGYYKTTRNPIKKKGSWKQPQRRNRCPIAANLLMAVMEQERIKQDL